MIKHCLVCISILLFIIGCTDTEHKPLSVYEIMEVNIPILPIYHLPADIYPNLEEVYYFYGEPGSSELRLDTYFLAKNSMSQKVRVARLSTFYLSGQFISVDETKGDLPEDIIWAKDGGSSCKVLPSQAYYFDYFVDQRTFQSCLYWLDKDLFQYKFYSVWPEKDAVEFVNSLSILKAGRKP